MVLVAAAVGAQLVDYGVHDLSIRALDSNDERGIMALLGDAALIAAALAGWLLAVRHRGRRAPVALSVLLTFLALDHATGLHDHVPHWRLVYLPLLAATFLALLVVADGGASAGRRLVVAGLVLLGASLVLHEIGGWLLARAGAAPDGWVFQIKVGVKHGTELAGWVLVALGLVDVVTRDVPRSGRVAVEALADGAADAGR